MTFVTDRGLFSFFPRGCYAQPRPRTNKNTSVVFEVLLWELFLSIRTGRKQTLREGGQGDFIKMVTSLVQARAPREASLRQSGPEAPCVRWHGNRGVRCVRTCFF